MTVENDARFVVSYYYTAKTQLWTVDVFDGEDESNHHHSDYERVWCNRWAANLITERYGAKEPTPFYGFTNNPQRRRRTSSW